uniref:Uncharacterized protein ycf33 n=2 Tax=Membranoptera TaxID=158697 RepID=A0A1L1Y9X7_9FLOR|nr:conserved hypothetical plastid protein Ycf33 [Membranoptera weeksiae]YP_009332857.1 conserved hypothetical plastid protein Ycf33 [Membranoptera tenuis]AHZ94651.1 conserved hypothetical plastid protein Ycf33 [Membranoptera weeksiae]AKL79113.1 conserved hypothetical plastid protein Ycf33 [Membranoptera tenuis]
MIYTFWNNLYKFPRFLVAVLVGFFLTTFQPIFKLLKNKKQKVIFTVITITIIRIIYLILKIMTE